MSGVDPFGSEKLVLAVANLPRELPVTIASLPSSGLELPPVPRLVDDVR